MRLKEPQRLDNNKSLTTLTDNKKNEIAKVLNQYGNKESLLVALGASIHGKAGKYPSLMFKANYPSLNTLSLAYSGNVIESLIMAHLESVNLYCGVTQKMEFPQMLDVANIIMMEYNYFKISELALFFYQYKAGYYGVFYGVIDPLKITTALIEFAQYRIKEINKIDREKQEKELSEKRKQWKLTDISREEYNRLVESGEYVPKLENANRDDLANLK